MERRPGRDAFPTVSYFYDCALPGPAAASIQILQTCRAVVDLGACATVYAGEVRPAACFPFYGLEPHEHYVGEPIGEPVTVSALGGHAKFQWKADWALRLLSGDIAYEMHGQDLADSARVDG